MSALLFLITLLIVIFAFSQFGHRISAGHATVWWLVCLLLLVAAGYPKVFHPLTELLNIKVVSNFILAALVMFLFLQVFELQASTTIAFRKLRQTVSEIAAKQFSASGPNSDGRILIIVPCYNEQDNVENIYRRCEKLSEQHKEINYLIINDGSTDRTAEILNALCPDHTVSHWTNVNVSGVLLTGFKAGEYQKFDYIVQCDADGQHPIEEIPRLIQHAKGNNYDLLIGSRYVCKNSTATEQGTTFSRRLGTMALSFTLRLLATKQPIHDPTSGFRIYSKNLFKTLIHKMPDEYPEPETIAIASLLNFKIGELAVQMSARQSGTSSLSGLKQARYMSKVISALIGLKLRLLFFQKI